MVTKLSHFFELLLSMSTPATGELIISYHKMAASQESHYSQLSQVQFSLKWINDIIETMIGRVFNIL